ncbi:MAG: polysaccharide biosynthesis tyrosine autokinase [Gulosibacter sp.]|uniref:polysaccharide biosynthesis tyrosine autokinase n=1 Tax=Gulosibacter sp. TaxID=2817531 RepID=UPI003F917136
MELREVLNILRKHWLLIVSLSVVGVLAGLGLALVTPPKYEATTQLYVSVRTSEATATSDLVQGTSFARDAVISYVDVVPSAIVLDRVVEDLDLDMTSTELAEQVVTSSPSDSVLLNILVTDEDPDQAAEIANAIGTVFIDVAVNELEQTDAGNESRVLVKTIQPAIADPAPVSPNLRLNLVLGLVLGLMVGIAIAVLRTLLDNRIHSVADVKGVTETPILGGISKASESTTKPLIVHDDPRSPKAEAFRGIRTNLQFLNYDGARRFVITSPGPGEGKTTTAANLAITLADAGASVALVDGDLRRPMVATMMGLEGAVGLTDVLIGSIELEDVLQPWGVDGLTVLPAGRIPPNPSELLGSESMELVINTLSESFDYVLIDAPPLLAVADAAVLSRHATGAILIAAARQTTRQELTGAIERLDAVDSRLLGIILTKVQGRGRSGYGYGTYGYAYEQDSEVGEDAPIAHEKVKDPVDALILSKKTRKRQVTSASASSVVSAQSEFDSLLSDEPVAQRPTVAARRTR